MAVPASSASRQVRGRVARLVRSANTRLPWHRLLRLEPREFREVAAPVLFRTGIEGWWYRQDLVTLFLLARDTPGTGGVLEIGSFKGLATTALALGARTAGRPGVTTVDPHTGDRQDLERLGVAAQSSLADFNQNMEAAGLTGEVRSHTMTSHELAQQWDGSSLRVLFIDGWHSYDAVTRDIEDWAPLVEAGGAVLIDDYGNYDDVRAAVEDHLALLPPVRRRVGRMHLSFHEHLSPDLQRYLRLPWG